MAGTPRRKAAVARAQAAAAQMGTVADRGLTRAQPALNLVAGTLLGLGRLVQVASLAGAAGTVGLVVLAVRDVGAAGLVAALFGLAPLAGWRVGRRAVRGAGLLGDPRRVTAAVQASGQSGREWLDHMAALGGAAKARDARRMVFSAVGAGRSLWRTVGPDVEGADDLRALVLWPRSLAMLAAGLVSPILLPVALIWALAVLLF